MRGPHLRQHLVQPLQRPVQVDLYPARCGRHVLAVVLRAPALHKGHADSAHLGQLVHRLEAVVHTLAEQLGKLLVVEYLQGTRGGDLAHSGGVEAVVVVTVAALDEDGRVRQALGIYLPPHVVKVDTLAYVASGVLNGTVAVYVTQLAEAEAITIVGRVGEAIHYH